MLLRQKWLNKCCLTLFFNVPDYVVHDTQIRVPPDPLLLFCLTEGKKKVSPDKMVEMQAKIEEERRALEAKLDMEEEERNKARAELEKREKDLQKAQSVFQLLTDNKLHIPIMVITIAAFRLSSRAGPGH